jgi:hypothetical protein
MEPDMAAAMWSQLSLRLKTGLILVLILVAIQFVLMPLVRWQANTVEQVDSLKSSVARKKALIGNEEAVSRLHKQSQQTLRHWQSLYLSGISDAQELQLSLQKKVEELAAGHGITVSNVDWLPAVGGGLIRGAVRFRLETPAEPLIKLIFALEADDHFIAVDGIRIHTRGRSKTEFTAELDVSAYAIDKALTLK